MVTTDRKHQILEVARELLQTQGYAGFSYQDLSDRLGIAKPSVHHHFSTKEALGLAVLDGYFEKLTEVREQLSAACDSPAARLRAFIEFGEKEACEQTHQICPGGAIHANYEVFPESIKKASRRLSDAAHEWISGILRDGRDSGEIQFPGTPEDEAWSLLARLQGARQLARTHGVQVWRSVARQVEKTLLQAP